MITRFAPSPTGALHLGHAFSALHVWDMATRAGGTALLRMEDIDTTRCRASHEDAIVTDLQWLGLTWPTPVLRQSTRRAAYDAALHILAANGLLYPCQCKRSDIRGALTAPQEGAPLPGPGSPLYPGTCRARPMSQASPNDALRLDMARAAALCTDIRYTETGPIAAGEVNLSPQHMVQHYGDIILARRDIGTSYHLAVVVDDAHQSITHVIRGADLAEATPIHALLQQLLNLPTPTYHHHALIRDTAGTRLAKRDGSRALALYRAEGVTPQELRQQLGLAPDFGLPGAPGTLARHI